MNCFKPFGLLKQVNFNYKDEKHFKTVLNKLVQLFEIKHLVFGIVENEHH